MSLVHFLFHPSSDRDPPWSNDSDERAAFDPNFDEFGDYTQRAIQTPSILDDSSSTLTPCPTFMANQHEFRTYQHAVNHEAPDFEKFRPYFGWVNVDTVQKTMEQSTQWGVSLPNMFPMKRHLKSRNPALNIPRRYEAVATDTVFSDTPAVKSGIKQAQVFLGRDTPVADAYPMKKGKQFANTLEDNIGRRGAMDKLLSDSAKTEISNKVMDILRAYHISNWHSEPYHQNQNLAEWRYRTIKSWTNTVMNRSGAPANCWLLCLIYVCYLLNHIACNALDGKIPLLALTGITPDISIILLFTFYQPVFYATYDQHFPSESQERAGYWVGFGEHCGDAMTQKILDHDTQKIICRSAVRPKKSSTPNHRLAPHGGEVSASSDLLKIEFPLDHHLEPQNTPHRNRRPLQSSSGPEMKRIHLDPSLCLHLTLVTALVGLSYFHLRRMGRSTELRLADRLLKSLTRTMVKG